MCQTVRCLVDQFLAWMEGRNRPRTIDYYRAFLDRFAEAVAGVPIAELKKHHLLTWGKTWHELQAVQRLFNWACVDMELIDKNPFAKIKRPRPGRRRRVLERREMIAMLWEAKPEMRAFLLAMRETISRPQEIRALRWDNLRLDDESRSIEETLLAGDARFELWDYKARDRRADPDAPRVIFVSARLGRLLCRLRRRGVAGDGFVFRNAQNRPWTSNAVRLRVRRLCRRAKLAPDERGEDVVAYTFRHTSATHACVNGVPDRILAELMGHTNTRTTARYQHLSIDHLREALRRLRDDREDK